MGGCEGGWVESPKYPDFLCSFLSMCSYLHILYLRENYSLSPINWSVDFQ